MIIEISTIGKIQTHSGIIRKRFSKAAGEKIRFSIGKINSIRKTITHFKETILGENLKIGTSFVTFAVKEIHTYQINATIKQTCIAPHVIRTHIVF